MGKAGIILSATPEVQEQYRNLIGESMMNAVRLLEKHDVNYFIGYGTLLGLYRDGDIITHDNDCDLCIDSRTINKAFVEDIKSCYDEITGNSSPTFFKYEDLLNAVDSYNKVELRSFRVLNRINGKLPRVCGRTTFADMFVFYPYAGDRYSKYGINSYQRIRGSLFNGTKRMMTKYGEVSVPSDIERCLLDEYGTGWKTPDENFRQKFSMYYGKVHARNVGKLEYSYGSGIVTNKNLCLP